jgi:putative ABC transport system substrate-binding protein
MVLNQRLTTRLFGKSCNEWVGSTDKMSALTRVLERGDASRIRKHAAELAALSPEVILTTGGQATELMLQATRTIPIVFAFVPDPVGSGFVESLAEPGGNATGFVQFEYSLSAKWPELLKEIAPNVNRAAVIWDPTITAGIGQFAVIQSVAPSIGIDVRPISVHSDIERVIAGFARVPNGGLIVAASAARRPSLGAN